MTLKKVEVWCIRRSLKTGGHLHDGMRGRLDVLLRALKILRILKLIGVKLNLLNDRLITRTAES